MYVIVLYYPVDVREYERALIDFLGKHKPGICKVPCERVLIPHPLKKRVRYFYPVRTNMHPSQYVF